MTELVLGIGLVALVLTVSGLASGLVERAPLSFPMIFLGLGFLLGERGLGLIRVDTHNPVLEMVAIVSLALVLFLDAVKVQVDEIRDDWHVPVLSLGPGTLLTIMGISTAAFFLVGTTPVQSLLLGAILSSTDPVVLRDIVRDERIPRSIRRALSIEAGMNDIVVLPIVLILIAFLTAQINSVGDLLSFLFRILLLSPLLGLAVGGVGAYLMGRADRAFGIRREYQALYGIGLVLAVYAAAQALGGDGFLASFFAGFAITLFNVSLCDCFVDYGEVTSEMMMLLTFVLFGAVLSSLLGTINVLPAFILAVIALFVVRPAALVLVLQRANMSNLARSFIGWFGPRGLNSLLLALLVVQASVPRAEYLLAVTGVVVVTSVIAHGVTATPLSAVYGRHVAQAASTLNEERESTFTGLFDPAPDEVDRITPEQLAELMKSDNPPLILDVRSRAHYERDDGQIPGSIRVLPDQIGDWAEDKPTDRQIVAYCTCPDEASSGRVARFLREKGFDAAALVGGYNAWHRLYPVELKGTISLQAVQ
jgi:NhaP-type Na+/H+ or K+/H+ antiporter